MNGQKDLTPYREPAIRGLFVVSHSRCKARNSLEWSRSYALPEYSLPDVLERLHHNQLALEAALMELTLSGYLIDPDTVPASTIYLHKPWSLDDLVIAVASLLQPGYPIRKI